MYIHARCPCVCVLRAFVCPRIPTRLANLNYPTLLSRRRNYAAEVTWYEPVDFISPSGSIVDRCTPLRDTDND